MNSSKQTTSHFYGRYYQHTFQWIWFSSKFKVYKIVPCNLPVNEHKRPNRTEIKDKNDNEAVAIVDVMSEISHDALP